MTKRIAMQPSLRTLLTGVIDYAGLFPPARLPLDRTLANYIRYRQENARWMLGRLVLPAARLGELHAFHDSLFASGPPLAISALGRGGNSEGEFLEGLTLDLEAIASCRAEYGDRVDVAVLETRLPAGPEMVALIKEAAEDAEQGEVFSFFEIGLSGDWQATLAHLVQGCAASGRAGLKLRCGGLEASAFPSVDQVADVIEDCVVAQVPLKFTAGLHHPLHCFDKKLKTSMHGFINVFLAGVLTTEHRLAEPTLRELLLEENPAAFRWEADSVGWREWSVAAAEVELARRYCVTSFGSCSFEEPQADLRALGWL
jgi:hypothetical protein